MQNMVISCKELSATNIYVVSRNQLILNNYQRLELLQKHKKIQESANLFGFLGLADWVRFKYI